MDPTTVFVIEVDGIVRRGFEVFFTAEGLRVVGSGSDLRLAGEDLERTRPDVLFVDLTSFPSSVPTGLETAIDEPVRPATLAYVRCDQIGRVLQAGVKGFVLRGSQPARPIEAVQKVAAGHVFHDVPAGTMKFSAAPPTTGPRVTPRELQISLLLAEGMSGAEIADSLMLSPTTIRTHIQNAMSKVDAKTRAHLVAVVLGIDQSPASAPSQQVSDPAPI